jgi:thiamine-monophosphate kinase
MAAVPVAVLLSYALPPGDVESGAATALQRGAEEAARRVGAALVGGDLSRSPGPLVLDVVVLGTASRPVLRSGARPGDELWVTGRLGASGAAVRLLERGERVSGALRDAYARPVPRVGEALWLQERSLLGAAIDLSDGLASDARHLAAASSVCLVLEAGRIPLDPAMAAVAGSDEDALDLALGGGEDYELLFAAPHGAVAGVAEGFLGRFAVPLTRVGRVVEGEGVALDRGGGDVEPVGPRGFDHFRGTASR